MLNKDVYTDVSSLLTPTADNYEICAHHIMEVAVVRIYGIPLCTFCAYNKLKEAGLIVK
jgi:hypothetical protein